MTVIILGSATFLAMNPDRPVDTAARHSGKIMVTIQNAAELPQDQVRDYTFGS
jgi:hypothetical protein